ncbi:GNAT family N-acetyltransferase [Hymenobacter nivis]|uniref:GNAT family N-acetyltransferase n=2 Tax=Hymenobacter nivis TaxID=1850093 RepID=A0A502GBH6_9BACT|nr:GNAT family N-acetyltransferase [Hymenobacter nivis]
MDRAAFVCSDAELTAYFSGNGSQPRTLTFDLKQRLAVTKAHVMLDENTNEIIGLFTLSNLSIPVSDLPTGGLRRGQHTDVAATLLGRMAVSLARENQGFGKKLVYAALTRAYQATAFSASAVIVVDPKREDLVPFYEKFEFTKTLSNTKPLRMFVPMKTVRDEVPHSLLHD